MTPALLKDTLRTIVRTMSRFLSIFAIVDLGVGFFAGVLTRWFVNASLFAYMIMCLAAFAATAGAQMLDLALQGHELAALLRVGLIQTLWSLPMAAVLYFPCRAIGRKKV